MKKIEAIIREERLEAVKKTLEEHSYFGLTVTDVSNRERQGSMCLFYLGNHGKVI